MLFFHLSQSPIPLPWKQDNYMSVFIRRHYSLFCLILFIYCYSLLLFVTLLSYSLFKMSLILPLDILCQKDINMHFFLQLPQQKAVKSRLIRHLLNFLKALNSWSNDLVVKVLDSQSRGPRFKTTGWLQDQLGLSSFWGWSVEYLELLKTEW